MDPETKLCNIYENRPQICRVTNPDKWKEILADCDAVHIEVYGVEREKEGVCQHKLSS